MWYITMICYAFRLDLDESMRTNIDELKVRHPEGFDTVKVNNRENIDV